MFEQDQPAVIEQQAACVLEAARRIRRVGHPLAKHDDVESVALGLARRRVAIQINDPTLQRIDRRPAPARIVQRSLRRGTDHAVAAIRIE